MDSEREGSSPAEVSTSVVTGAFGFSGQQIAQRLLLRDEKVRTLTNHPHTGSPLFGRVQVSPLDFTDTKQLTESMRGASVLYNTYWVRFSYGGLSHERAVDNTKALIHAAEAAGVKRIVHVSITNPSIDSPLPYFKGKAELEQAIQSSSLSYAILRPAVLFGEGDILINNIAFMLKRFPLFAIPGSGEYHVQPIFVGDLAELAVDSGQRPDSYTVDAVGPESYTYTELVKMIRDAIGSKSLIVHLPPAIIRLASGVLGAILKDVILTEDEIKGLMGDLLVSHRPPTGRTSLEGWIKSHAETIGSSYASELARHYLSGNSGKNSRPAC
ncbi:MAG TPA: NAD(P)H-binding protein [Terriglobales bacterium]|nr:NAD(P)H-binding protein [Terriglobales bacterium]